MLRPVTRSATARMAPEDRRRQLIGVGLRMLTERPIQAVSVDAVAAEVGISRGLLFHYFPTKTDYYDAVLDAAVRRTLRNTEPD
nr:TetR/AcrR family transcriptional regulator [Candidatus Nanopelagicales bacterium]